jgi:RecJ-like exonuclease
MNTSNDCPDCGGSGFQPDLKAECLRCDGYGRLRLSQRETAPVLLNRPWSAVEDFQRYDRQMRVLRWVAFGLACITIGVILGKLFL